MLRVRIYVLCACYNAAAACEQISQFEKVNKARPRYVVFTQGPDPTIIAVEGKVCGSALMKPCGRLAAIIRT